MTQQQQRCDICGTKLNEDTTRVFILLAGPGREEFHFCGQRCLETAAQIEQISREMDINA